MHTERLKPQAQQTNVGTPARSSAATDSTASRINHGGFSPPSESGKRSRTNSRGNSAAGSLSASSMTASIPNARAGPGSRRSPAFPNHKGLPMTCLTFMPFFQVVDI